MFKAPLGMKDILPEEALKWQKVEERVKKIFHTFGYQPIRTPILEEIKLFNRSLGNQTEIVQKQMFELKRQDEVYVLRPEGTASVVRAYLEGNIDKKEGFIKLYYLGPMFRAERPQKGRLRQFHHIGVESLGSDSPFLDSEIILLAQRILEDLNISGHKIYLNSLGCLKDKENLSHILHNKLKIRLKELCQDCNSRFKRNVFRVLDCKNDACKKVISDLELDYNDYLCKECFEHFQTLRGNLDALGVPYIDKITLVRGLDYYTRTVFEITHPSLGAQDAIGAGGRYDNLVSELGGPKIGAIGFALGVERLMLASSGIEKPKEQAQKVFVITLGESAKKEGFILLDKLRREKIAADLDYEGKSLKSQMRRANDSNAKFVVLLGEDELKKSIVTLKDMQAHTQEEIGLDDFVEEIKRRV